MVKLPPLCPGHDDLKITSMQHKEPDYFMLVVGGESPRWLSNGQLKAAVPGLMNVTRRPAENE